mgnify:CR=1 FL=1
MLVAPDLAAAYHQYPACGCSANISTAKVCYNQTSASASLPSILVRVGGRAAPLLLIGGMLLGRRYILGAGCNGTPKNKFGFMGYTVRTTQWRYTVWVPWKGATAEPDWEGDYAGEYSGSGSAVASSSGRVVLQRQHLWHADLDLV